MSDLNLTNKKRNLLEHRLINVNSLSVSNSHFSNGNGEVDCLKDKGLRRPCTDTSNATAPKMQKNDGNDPAINLDFKMFGVHQSSKSSVTTTNSEDQIALNFEDVVSNQSRSIQTNLTGEEIDHMDTERGDSNDEKVFQLRGENEHLKSSLREQSEEIKVYKNSAKKMIDKIKCLLVEKCQSDRAGVEIECYSKKLTLGHFNFRRVGSAFQESWVEGRLFTNLYTKRENLIKQKKEFDRQRKYLLRRRLLATGTVKHQNGVTDEFPLPDNLPPLSEEEYGQLINILKLKMFHFRKEEIEVQTQIESLDKDRNIHIRSLRSFKHNPTLNNRYLLLNLLGKGGFSEVFKAYDTEKHSYCACKIHKVSKDWKEDKRSNYIRHSLREADIHKKLHHSRIVKLLDVFELDSNSFCTILEYCDGNDLDFYLKQNKFLTEKEGKCIIIQVVSALKYLSDLNPPIIHYDLKPGNILMASGETSGEIKITDFGLSKIMTHENTSDTSIDLTSQGAGTYWYLPPECFKFGKIPPKISSKVDVWSVGVIYYQLLTGKKPFGHYMSQNDILHNNIILQARIVDFPSKPLISNEAKAFIKRCLIYDKDERPDVKKLSQDEYLHNYSKTAFSKNPETSMSDSIVERAA